MIAQNSARAQTAREEGSFALIRSEYPTLHLGLTDTQLRDRELKAQALVQVLAAFDILSNRPYNEQQEIIDSILRIFLGSVE